MTRRIVEVAVDAASAAAGAARHLLWYLAYRVDGSARADEGPAVGGPTSGP